MDYFRKHKQALGMVVIVLVGAFLCFYKLGQVPNGAYVDEAMIGYNAYSIAKTGVDEYGKAFPIFLRSFNAYSSPLYVYASAIPISIINLSVFSTRFVSALSGSLTIIFIYLILKETVKFKQKWTPLLGALIFAISPWHIFFSRGAFEASLGLLLLSIAIYFLIKAEQKTQFFLYSSIVFGISTYSYHSLRIIPLMLLPAYAYYLLRKRKISLKPILASFAVFSAVVLPQTIVMMTPAFGARAEGLFYANVILTQANKIYALPKFLAVILSAAREFLSQFIAYFSPRNIFFLGDPDLQRSVPEMGLYYRWLVVPFAIGVYSIFRKNFKKRFLLSLMLVSFAAPAAFAEDPFSAVRSLNLIIPFTIIITVGLSSLINKIGTKKSALILFVLIFFSLLNFWRSYFILLKSERAATWGYGYEQLADYIKNSSEHFVIDTSRIKPPHILMAFYMKIDPAAYQKFSQDKITNGYYSDLSQDMDYELLNFSTRQIDWKKDVYVKQILVGDELAVSETQAEEQKLKKVFEIKDPLGHIVFQGYETNPDEKCKSINNENPLCYSEL